MIDVKLESDFKSNWTDSVFHFLSSPNKDCFYCLHYWTKYLLRYSI